MKRSHNTRHRPAQKSKRRSPARATGTPSARTFRSHPLFGQIPLLPVVWIDAANREHRILQYDPDYAPPLPVGAVRGNVRNQQFCSNCHVPRYFFVDRQSTCVQCLLPFVFTASEQKYWYETLKFHFDSVATRCSKCRRARRSDNAVARTLAAARAQVEARSSDAGAHVALAEAIVRYVERHGSGPLKDAIAASRSARKLARGHSGIDACESLFWEGCAQALAGRNVPARDLLQQFIALAPKGRRLAGLVREAENWLIRVSVV